MRPAYPLRPTVMRRRVGITQGVECADHRVCAVLGAELKSVVKSIGRESADMMADYPNPNTSATVDSIFCVPRLRLKLAAALPGYVYGGWWPRSLDPVVESQRSSLI